MRQKTHTPYRNELNLLSVDFAQILGFCSSYNAEQMCLKRHTSLGTTVYHSLQRALKVDDF